MPEHRLQRTRSAYCPCEIGDSDHMFVNVVGIPTESRPRTEPSPEHFDPQAPCIFCGVRFADAR